MQNPGAPRAPKDKEVKFKKQRVRARGEISGAPPAAGADAGTPAPAANGSRQPNTTGAGSGVLEPYGDHVHDLTAVMADIRGQLEAGRNGSPAVTGRRDPVTHGHARTVALDPNTPDVVVSCLCGWRSVPERLGRATQALRDHVNLAGGRLQPENTP